VAYVRAGLFDCYFTPQMQVSCKGLLGHGLQVPCSICCYGEIVSFTKFQSVLDIAIKSKEAIQ